MSGIGITIEFSEHNHALKGFNPDIFTLSRNGLIMSDEVKKEWKWKKGLSYNQVDFNMTGFKILARASISLGDPWWEKLKIMSYY